MSVVGIDDIALHFPRLYFAMQDFAEFRGADYGKLSKGLGLEAMAYQMCTKTLRQWVQMLFPDLLTEIP